MHNGSRHKLRFGAALLMAYGTANAAPFESLDPRSMAMGGAGVAVGNAATAPLFNPALLAATHDGDNFALELPIIGARLADPDDVIDAIDEFQESTVVDDLDFAIDAFNTSDAKDTESVRTAASALDRELVKLGGKPLQGDLGAAVVLGVPSKQGGVAVTAGATASFGGVVNYRDTGTFQALDADLLQLETCYALPDQAAAEACIAAASFSYVDSDVFSPTFGEITFDAGGDDADVESSVDVRGLILQEIAVSFAREVEWGGQTFAVGVTPKYVKATVFDYRADVDDADDDDFNGEDYTHDYSHFNLDIGVAKDYVNGWRAGLVVKNLIAQSYDTYRLDKETGVKEKTGHTIKTAPQVRIGGSLQRELYTLAADLDLTENDSVGYDGNSRYLALGAEFNAWNWAQLRVGYRANLANSRRNVWSAGLGLSPFGAHLDLAVSGSDEEIGAALQLGFRF